MDKKEIIYTSYLFIPPPPTGFVKQLESELKVSRQTVNRALYKGMISRNAELIRKRYYELYVKPYLPQED